MKALIIITKIILGIIFLGITAIVSVLFIIPATLNDMEGLSWE